MTTPAADPTSTTAPAAPPPVAAAPSPPRPRPMVILENVTREPITLLLDVHTEAASFIRRVNVVVEKHDRETGAMSTAVERRRIPSSITLWPKGMAGCASKPLPREVTSSTDVARAVKAGRVRVKPVAAPAAPAEAPKATPAPAPTPETPAAPAAALPETASEPEPAPTDEPPADQSTPRRGRKER